MITGLHVTVLGGFPVVADVSIAKADPSAGFFYDAIEETILRSPKTGKEFGDWLWRRIESTKDEASRLDSALWDAIAARYGD